MTSEAVNDRERAAATEPPSNPWTRVLGILVLGSFAAATKTARSTRRSRPAEPREVAA